jgi:LysM repeat protein
LAVTAAGVGFLAWHSRSDSSTAAPPTRPTTTVTTRPSPSVSTTRFAPDPVSYVIKAHEGLFDIAKRNGLTLEQLASFNGITNPDSVYAGEVILIPPAQPTTSTSSTKPKGPTTTATIPVATTLPDDPPKTTAGLMPGQTTTTSPP